MSVQTVKLYIGTSGYSYKDWKGVFYPDSFGSQEYLQFYAKQFPFVEINFSYYKHPSADMLHRMVEKTPSTFQFSIKAHQSLTHKRGGRWEQDAKMYIEGIQPLIDAERLAGVLFQFPYSFHRTAENRRYLGTITDYFSSLPIFIEFRNGEWMNDDVFGTLKDRNIGFVNTDSPELDSLPGKTELITSERGYIRFHGRNSETWWSGDNVSRYDYCYTEEELKEWVVRIQRMLEKVTVLFIAFNNHHKGQAVRNAMQLRGLFDG